MLLAALISGCVIDLTNHDRDIWDGTDVGYDTGWTGSDWSYGYPDAPSAVGSFDVTSAVWMGSTSVGLAADGAHGGVDLGSAVCHFISRNGQIDSDVGTSATGTIDVGGLTDDGSVSIGRAGGDAWAVSAQGATAFGLSDVVSTAVEGDRVAILGGSRCAVHLGSARGALDTHLAQPEAACTRGGLRLVEGHAYTADGLDLLVDGQATPVATATNLFDVDPASDTALLAEGTLLRAARLSTGETLWSQDLGADIRDLGVGGDPAWVHVLVDGGTRTLVVYDLDGALVTEGEVESTTAGGGWPFAVAREAGTVAVGTGSLVLVMNR